MTVVAQVIRSQSFSRALSLIPQNKEDFSIISLGTLEVVHSFVPDRYFCTWYVITRSPTMGFTFNDDRRVIRAKIKAMELSRLSYPNFNRKIRLNTQSVLT